MKQINLRLPDDLHAQIVAAAAQDDRSMNKEILCLVREALAERTRRSN
jgi:hypothetical protein